MDQERNIENEKTTEDQFMLPGFRFHPTDEELVGFYLRRKIMQKPLSIELIKQLDIYKYDPWDLPKLATTGEKEWYFYCPRDRKYRNSARPNRVTGAGFWKATGTDRPIYSSEGSKCIGLKKSLVFYKGRAAKGIKTDWMMHEFRLPSVSESVTPKKYLDKNIPANEAWAICRIFKKANSSSQRALSHSWISPPFDITPSDIHTVNPNFAVNNVHLSSINMITTMANKTNIHINPPLHFGYHRNDDSSVASFSPLHFPPACKLPLFDHHPMLETSVGAQTISESPPVKNCGFVNDASSLLQDMSSSVLGELFAKGSGDDAGFATQFCGFSTENNNNNNAHENICRGEKAVLVKDQINIIEEEDDYGLCDGYWKSNSMWDYSSPSCPSELSTSYSTNNCYT